MAALPEELKEDILSRLPVKSLLRFKTASKNWHSLISEDHKFAKFHLKQSSSASNKNLFFFKLHLFKSIFQSSDIDSYAIRRTNFPDDMERPYRLVGSANGLVCVALYYENCCCIWNPSTAECKRISVPIRLEFGFEIFGFGYEIFGFGYDSISDDNKILGIFLLDYQIFSWKILKHNSITSTWRRCALYSNRALHWCLGPKITAFDLATDQFFYLDLPKESVSERIYVYSWVPFFDYQGSLCTFGIKSIWVMKEYDNSKSWAKLSTLTLPKQYVKPVCISRLGELVFCTKDGFVKSDIHGRMSDEDAKKLKYREYEDAGVYEESLISPKCFD